MWSFFDERRRKARKPFVCDEGRCEIRPGETYYYGSGKFDGWMVEQRLCEACKLLTSEFMAQFGDDFPDGFPTGECRQLLRGEYEIEEDPIVWAFQQHDRRARERDAEAARRAAEAWHRERRAVALADIADERDRQVSGEGWSIEHDDAHVHGDLARAAAVYALGIYGRMRVRSARGWFARRIPLRDMLWPWALCWFKPRDRRRDLVRAGALIVAELERLDRAAQRAREGWEAKHGALTPEGDAP